MVNSTTQNGYETKKNNSTNKRFKTVTIAKIAILGAVASLLMLFDIPLFFAPSFYKLDCEFGFVRAFRDLWQVLSLKQLKYF